MALVQSSVASSASVAHFDVCYVYESVLREAIKLDRLEILQWLVLHRSSIAWTRSEVEFAVRMRHLELAKWLLGVDGTWRSKWSGPAVAMEFWATLAASNGDLPMLEWICSLSTGINMSRAFAKAVVICRLDVVKWVLEQARNGAFDLVGTPARSGPDADKPRRIILDGRGFARPLEMVEWLIRYNVDECDVRTWP